MIIAMANQKGGVAKTTTAVNLAHGLARAGHTVLLVDMDPQSNATLATLGAAQLEQTIYQVLIGEATLADVVQETKTLGLYIVPTTIDLAGAEVELHQLTGGQLRLRSALADVQTDFVIIDAPPSLGILTINTLAAADSVIVPVGCGVFALQGIAKLEETIADVRTHLARPDLNIMGVVVTLYDHTNVARDIQAALQERFGAKLFDAIIPKNVRIEEAHSRAQSIFTWAPESKGAEAYQQLVTEALNRAQQ